MKLSQPVWIQVRESSRSSGSSEQSRVSQVQWTVEMMLICVSLESNMLSTEYNCYVVLASLLNIQFTFNELKLVEINFTFNKHNTTSSLFGVIKQSDTLLYLFMFIHVLTTNFHFITPVLFAHVLQRCRYTELTLLWTLVNPVDCATTYTSPFFFQCNHCAKCSVHMAAWLLSSLLNDLFLVLACWRIILV